MRRILGDRHMPLTRATVTVASRIMLPTYVVLMVTIGSVYTFDPLDRLGRVHALSVQRELMGGQMTNWGLMFLAVAAVMVASLATHKRLWFVFALYLCAATFLLWAVLYGWSAVTDPDVSLLAPAYPLFVVAACHASAKSLLHGER